MEWIEDGDDDVDKDGAHEDDVAPEGHVTRDPKQSRIASQLFLPFHLGKHVLRFLEEVENF